MRSLVRCRKKDVFFPNVGKGLRSPKIANLSKMQTNILAARNRQRRNRKAAPGRMHFSEIVLHANCVF